MPFLLRKIRQGRWLKDSDQVSWLTGEELPADTLSDLTTSSNTLSVYVIDDNLSNVVRVAAALAATADSLSNFDYVLINIDVLTELHIRLASTLGRTPDHQVNLWHRDLIELSANKLLRLAQHIWKKDEYERLPEKKMLDLIVESVSAGYIDRHRINIKSDKLLKRLG